MNKIAIGPGTQVTLHFALKLPNGKVIDSNFESKPARFTVGDGNMLPGFEAALAGLQAGDKESFQLPPEKAFGQPNPNNIQSINRDNFADDIDIAEGLVVSFKEASGGEVPGVITEYNDSEVTVDFNHPLAGRTITFEVKILAVEPTITH